MTSTLGIRRAAKRAAKFGGFPLANRDEGLYTPSPEAPVFTGLYQPVYCVFNRPAKLFEDTFL